MASSPAGSGESPTSDEREEEGDMTTAFVDKQGSPKRYTEDTPPREECDEVVLVEETVPVLSKRGIFFVPAQIQSLVGPAAKGRWLGGMVACGAAVTFFVSPLIGMQSDRATFTFGKRRPVMFLASIAQLNRGTDNNKTGKLHCNKDLVALRCAPYWNSSTESPLAADTSKGAQQPNSIVLQHNSFGDGEGVKETTSGSIALFIVFYLIVTSAFAGVTVPYNALIADKSHPSQRGLNSGVMAAMILIGNVSGAAVGTSFTHIGVPGAYSISISIVVVTLLITIFTTTEEQGKHMVEPVGCMAIFTGFWDPLRGVSTVTGFLEYWLHDMVYLPNCWTAATCVAIMLLPMLFAAACSSIVFGIISDRTSRRKPIVIGAAVIMSDRDKAKDIAVWHQALILPNALATPVGGFILDYFQSVDCKIGLGYIILFSVTAVYFCLSGIFVTRIKRAR
ncbi:hypothetical protein MAR_027892 [Mya arenaria]|uniref:Uncharacterized protein n=1 Tax=Mya arenaria TaxID=6604 RepID=A0ABY7DC13_MYAAR|nr:hypothetical protein MAR_027892 [Mya arenaria]